MLERTEIGRQVRQYFIQVEKEAKKAYMQLVAAPKLLPTLQQEATDTLSGWLRAAQLLKVPMHLAEVEAIKAAKVKTGIDYTTLLLASPAQNVIEDRDQALEPTEIGKRFGMQGTSQKIGRAVNRFLAEIGWQKRVNGYWEAIGNGKKILFGAPMGQWCQKWLQFKMVYW